MKAPGWVTIREFTFPHRGEFLILPYNRTKAPDVCPGLFSYFGQQFYSFFLKFFISQNSEVF